MNLRSFVSCGFVCAALVMAGCDEGRQAPGKVTVQIANVAPGFDTLTFRREQDERNDATLQFKGATLSSYDADTYDFFVIERRLSADDPGHSWTFAPTLESSMHYAFVLTEVAGEVQPVVIEYPEAPAADAQILALHAASGLPAIDLYLERPGVGIAGATPRGTFNAQEQIAAQTLPGGDYELFLTAAGNPADVLLSSAPFNLLAGATSTIVVVPEGGLGTAQISALVLQAPPLVLVDQNAPAELRAINGATDQAPRDLGVDSQFSPPFFSAMSFGQPTPYAQVAVGTRKINVTPVGNPGVLELDSTLGVFIGERATMLFGGPAGALVPSFAVDDGRRLNHAAKMRFMNVASQFLAVDYVLTRPDGDPNVEPTQAQLLSPGISSYVPLYPGEYDLYVYAAGTPTRLSGPTRVSVAAGGIYGALAVDGPDTATANVLLFDDLP
jgi:hypothetical protein